MSQGLGTSFDRAQRAHDAQMPPEDHDCEAEGHVWRLKRTGYDRITKEVVREFTCKHCPAVSVS